MYICLVKYNFDVIKMHGTTIKKAYKHIYAHGT